MAAAIAAISCAASAQFLSDGTRPFADWPEAEEYYRTGGETADREVAKRYEALIQNFISAAQRRDTATMNSLLASEATESFSDGENSPGVGGGPPTLLEKLRPLNVEAFVEAISKCRLITVLSGFSSYRNFAEGKTDVGSVLTWWNCPDRSEEKSGWNFAVSARGILHMSNKSVTL